MHLKTLTLIILLSLISCSKNKTANYIGNIDNKVNGEIRISNIDNNIEGSFHNLDNNSEIKLKGKIIKNKLSLSEYANDNVISGYFEGVIRNNTYKGSWFNTDKTIEVPFNFKLKNPEFNKKKKVDNNITPIALSLDQKKLNEGLEKRNILLYKFLDDISLSLKKEKRKLTNIENDTYYSKVKKEKKILTTKKSIKDIESALSKLRTKISDQQFKEPFPFQKTPEGVVNQFFNSLRNKNFSKLQYVLDPYGKYSDNIEILPLLQVYENTIEFKNITEDFIGVNSEIINTRIDNNNAYVLSNVEKTYKTNEILFTLVKRNEFWYLIDFSK